MIMSKELTKSTIERQNVLNNLKEIICAVIEDDMDHEGLKLKQVDSSRKNRKSRAS